MTSPRNRLVSSLMIFCLSLSLSLNRLVHSGPGKGSPQAGVDLSFATRTGTRQGIETHLFRAETSRDLSHWTRSIVQGCHNSAELVTEVTTGEHAGSQGTHAPSTPPPSQHRFQYWPSGLFGIPEVNFSSSKLGHSMPYSNVSLFPSPFKKSW